MNKSGRQLHLSFVVHSQFVSICVQALMMPKHEHKLEVLLEDRQINIQDENLLMHMSLLDLQLCVTIGDDKATTHSLSRKKITILCLHKTFHFQLMIQI